MIASLLYLWLLLLLLLFHALQHPPVYTLGAGSSEEHVKFDVQHPPHPLYRTERGGEVTYHGPGQVRGTFGLLATLDSSPLAVVDTENEVVKAFIALLLVRQHCHFQHLNLPLLVVILSPLSYHLQHTLTAESSPLGASCYPCQCSPTSHPCCD